jgi:hypothetical protein
MKIIQALKGKNKVGFFFKKKYLKIHWFWSLGIDIFWRIKKSLQILKKSFLMSILFWLDCGRNNGKSSK